MAKFRVVEQDPMQCV